jgi:hypothetical protein
LKKLKDYWIIPILAHHNRRICRATIRMSINTGNEFSHVDTNLAKSLIISQCTQMTGILASKFLPNVLNPTELFPRNNQNTMERVTMFIREYKANV